MADYVVRVRIHYAPSVRTRTRTRVCGCVCVALRARVHVCTCEPCNCLRTDPSRSRRLTFPLPPPAQPGPPALWLADCPRDVLCFFFPLALLLLLSCPNSAVLPQRCQPADPPRRSAPARGHQQTARCLFRPRRAQQGLSFQPRARPPPLHRATCLERDGCP